MHEHAMQESMSLYLKYNTLSKDECFKQNNTLSKDDERRQGRTKNEHTVHNSTYIKVRVGRRHSKLSCYYI